MSEERQGQGRDEGQETRARRVEKEMDAAAGGCGPRAAAFGSRAEQSRAEQNLDGTHSIYLFSWEGKNLEFLITGKGNKGKRKGEKEGQEWIGTGIGDRPSLTLNLILV